MKPIDPALHTCQALVVDGMPTSRSTLSSMLRDLGVPQVATCTRPSDAHKLLSSRRFDIILCESRFDCGEAGGQELLDELRRSRLLPLHTVFLIVTSEATRARVSEAAEASLDGYLVKPATAAALLERLTQARRRKLALAEIFQAIEAGRLEEAAVLCHDRYAARGDYWVYAARIGAEVLLRLGRTEAARKFFENLERELEVPWGRLGVARTQLENGSGQQARRTIETLLAEFPQYADAHDLMGRMHIDLGDFAQALATYRLAASITPRSLTRLQKQGALAFYIGDIDEAAEVLHRAVQLDPHNRLFDLQTLALICLVEYERGDAAALHRMHRRIQAVQKLHPESARLRHLVLVADTLAQAQNGDLNGARASLAHLADERQDTDFDVEAASNLLSTLARLHHHGITHDQAVAWAHDLGLRFCASSAATELLCGAARDHPDMQAELRAAHDAIGKVCESAMDLSRKGQPREAVLALIAAATQSRNARELDLADRLLRHHQSSIADAPALRQQIREAQQRYCSKGSRLPITHAGREAGALALNI